MNKKIKLIYISGIGRSGTTLLDMMISTNKKVFSVGEIYKFNQMRKENIICSCGENFNQCNLWKKFKNKKIIIQNKYKVLNYLKVINYLYNPFSKNIGFKEKSDNTELFEEIRRESQSNPEYILDSSKDIARLIELKNDKNFDIYNITMIRDGRAVANSFNSPIGRKEKNYLISLFKWIFVNSLHRRFIKSDGLNNLIISYDELINFPDKTIKRIEEFLSIKIPENYTKVIREFDYHNIGGNRLATLENRKKFKGIIAKDDKWKRDQGKMKKFMANIITYYFNKKWLQK